MKLFLLYLVVLAILTGLGAAVGYASETRYPGSGSLVAVGIFMVAVWLAWTISVRVSDRFWPEKPAA
jgi:hypothetical protein